MGPESIARGLDRHSHISIPLQLQLEDRGHRVEAMGWNALGFNFYFAQLLEQPVLVFKRGLLQFEGSMAWRAPNAGQELVQAALVNELIYKRAQGVARDVALNQRLLNLIRVPGRVADKRRILASLGLDIDDARLAQLVARRIAERPMYQYGVRVQSDAWTAVSEKAYSMSAAVAALENWSQSLGKK